jgi:hypothetical protein
MSLELNILNSQNPMLNDMMNRTNNRNKFERTKSFDNKKSKYGCQKPFL